MYSCCMVWLHQYKQDTIIKAFEQTGISLCPSDKNDHKLHVHGIPDLVVGPWQIELESDEELEYFAEPEGLPPGLQPEQQPEVLLQPSLQLELQPGICN